MTSRPPSKLSELLRTGFSASSPDHPSHMPYGRGAGLAVTPSAWQDRSVPTNVQSPCHPNATHGSSKTLYIQHIINGLVMTALAGEGRSSVAGQHPADEKGRLIGKGI